MATRKKPGARTVAAKKPKKKLPEPPRKRTASRRSKAAKVLFTGLGEAERYVTGILVADIPKAEADALAQNFVLFCDGYDASDWPNTFGQVSGEVDIGAPLGIGEGPWAIREKELSDLKVVAGLVAGGFAGHPYDFAAIVVSALCMIWRLRRKGVALGPLQLHVLLALRKHGRLQLEALAEATRAYGQEWSVPDVEDSLKELGAMRLNDGTVEPLVQCDGGGYWSTDARGLWERPFGTFR